MMRILLAVAVVLSVSSAAPLRQLTAESTIRDSLRHIPPKWRGEWLRARDIDWPGYTSYRQPDTGQGLRLVGKYGRGPSGEVTGQDTLVFVCLGSELAIINFAAVDSPRIITELQLGYVPTQAVVKDSILLTGRNGIDIWSIADIHNPRHLSTIPCFVGDFALRDTLLCFITADTFMVYSVADPANPLRIGTCPDSGNVTAISGGTAITLDGNSLDLVDITQPSNPHTVGIWPGWALSAAVRGNLCCAAFSDPAQQERSWFLTLDISDPAQPRQLARLDSICGYDINLSDSLAFVSGRDAAYREGFRIVSIADSAHPRAKGTCGVTDYRWGVWADPARDRAYVANEPGGLAVIDISNQALPSVDTMLLTADLAYDVCVDGALAYVADFRGGLRIVDVTNPASPTELGGYDSGYLASKAVVARDSFAFIGWQWLPYLLSIDVTDPARTERVGGGAVETVPEDMVLRDTLLYVAGRLRLNIINVARPRQPVLVGSCGLPGTPGKLEVSGSIAYVATQGVQCIDVADPSNPHIVGSYGSARVSGLSVVDTIVYGAAPYTGLIALSVANPAAPRLLDSLWLTDTLWWTDVVVTNSLAYVGGERVWVVDVSDPQNLRVVPGASWTPPGFIERLVYANPHVYVACSDAGVCVLDTATVGIAEQWPVTGPQPAVRLHGSIVQSELVFDLPETSEREVALSTYDMTGRCVEACVLLRHGQQARYSFARLPAGVYVLRARANGRMLTFKVVKL